MTYNQSRYITDTMDGFCMQQTSFPFVCCIVDDASTDGQQTVIADYLNRNFDVLDSAVETDYARILFARHKQNPNCHFAVLLLKENHYQSGRNHLKFGYISQWMDNSDYLAFCEGDDYWTNPLKLHRQAGHMDNNPDCMLCCTDAEIESACGSRPVMANYSNSCIVPAHDMIVKGGSWICTCTCMFRPAVIERYLELECTLQCHVGDWCWQILSVILGNAYFINEKTACYRFASSGSWTSHISDIDPLRRLPEIKSISDMLLGLDEFSEVRFHAAFSKSIGKYMHDKALLFCKSKTAYASFKKTCRKAWRYLSLRQRLVLYSYRFKTVERLLVYCKKLQHTI